MSTQTIHFGDEGQAATRELVKRFEALRPEISQGTTPAMTRLRESLRRLEAIDRQYGGLVPLPLEDAESLATTTIVDLAHLDADCRREGFQEAPWQLAQLAVGVALWSMRHGVAVTGEAVEHVTNALALLANHTLNKHELAAIFGLMRGFVDHVRPQLGADPERSNPLRPWRLLNVNLAITAIRTEEPKLMEAAFDMLDDALPQERAGFYAEATAAALNPRVAAVVREKLEERHRKWNMG